MESLVLCRKYTRVAELVFYSYNFGRRFHGVSFLNTVSYIIINIHSYNLHMDRCILSCFAKGLGILTNEHRRGNDIDELSLNGQPVGLI